jgi:hypothetical protein
VYHGVLAFSPRTDFEGETSGGDGQHFPIHETLHTLMPLLLDGLLDQALDSPLASLRPGDQAHGSSRRQSQRTHGFLLPARNPWESLIVRNKRDELTPTCSTNDFFVDSNLSVGQVFPSCPSQSVES